ncbi:Putative ribonuclease H protein At1g65750 [Linum perenne]
MMNSFWWGTNQNGGGGIAWMRWERMCVRKEVGGLGFRDLLSFNMAMVYKAKYFPKGDFLSAEEGSNPSFVWKSVLATQVETEMGAGHHDTVVNDLLIPGTWEWDDELLEELFLAEDRKWICGMKAPTGCEADWRIWRLATDGRYSVKTAYHYIMEQSELEETLGVAGEWRRVWEVGCPPKVKQFLWRTARRVLPTRNAIVRRGLEVEDTCGLCDGDAETTEHVFLTAVKCWEVADMSRWLEEVGEPHEADFNEWLFKVLLKFDVKAIRQAMGVLWSIWAERNRRVWQKEARPEELVIKEGRELMSEWKVAHERRSNLRQTEQRPRCDKWHPPRPQVVKVNVDGAIFPELQQYGMGAVIRGPNGEFGRMMQQLYDGNMPPREVEAHALREALRWTSMMDLQEVVFEVDSRVVWQAVTKEASNSAPTEFGRIIAECRRELERQRSSTLVAVRRNSNRVAHVIARNSRYSVRTYVGEGPPEWLVTCLDDICLISHD